MRWTRPREPAEGKAGCSFRTVAASVHDRASPGEERYSSDSVDIASTDEMRDSGEPKSGGCQLKVNAALALAAALPRALGGCRRCGKEWDRRGICTATASSGGGLRPMTEPSTWSTDACHMTYEHEGQQTHRWAGASDTGHACMSRGGCDGWNPNPNPDPL